MKPLSNIMKSDLLSEKKISPFSLKEVSFITSSDDEDMSLEKRIGGELSKIEREAYEKGFSAGEEAGRMLGLRKLDPTEKILLNTIKEVNHLKEIILKESEEDMLTIALAVARRILGQEVMGNPEIILRNIQTGILKIAETEKVTIRLHPDDLEIISQDADDIVRPLDREILLTFEADHGLSPGDCIVEGKERMVDARPLIQLRIFDEILRGKT